jgi:hypothetical protein
MTVPILLTFKPGRDDASLNVVPPRASASSATPRALAKRRSFLKLHPSPASHHPRALAKRRSFLDFHPSPASHYRRALAKRRF